MPSASLTYTPPKVKTLSKGVMFSRAPALGEGSSLRYRLADGVQADVNFKGQYCQKKGRSTSWSLREGPANKLIRYYMRQGKHLKASKALLAALSELYAIILKAPQLKTFESLGGYSPLAGELLQTQVFYNPHNLIRWLGWKSRQTFALKCFNTPKRYKRKLKKAHTVRLITVHPNARVNIALKLFHFFTEEQDQRRFHRRIFATFLDALFKYKHGTFQKRRARTYRTALLRMRNQGGGFSSA